MRLLTIILILNCSFVYAQKDKVYTTRGKKIKGEIIQRNQEGVRLIKDEMEIFIPNSKIAEIHSDSITIKKVEYPKGLYKVIGLGLLAGKHSDRSPNTYYPLIEMGATYRINALLNPGIFGALNVYDIYGILPVFIENKIFFNERINSPYLFVRGGKGILLGAGGDDEFGNSSSAGLFFGSGVGLQKKSGNNYWGFNFGWQLQKTEEVDRWFNFWNGEIEGERVIKRTMNRLHFSVSYSF